MHTIVKNSKFMIVTGSGGVGKTTTSAVLGLCGAKLQKRTLVITIDPAKRLAQSLGLGEVALKPTQVAADKLLSLGIHGRLDVMMLDMKQAWDSFIHRFVKDESKFKAITKNRFYYHLSRELAGSQEFIACEQLYELAHQNTYDLIVLDTPPTSHALDFLQAPERILGFLDPRVFHFFMGQRSSLFGRFAAKFAGGLSEVVQGMLEKITGSTLLIELKDFLILFSDVFPHLVKRTQAFQSMLKQPSTQFCIVCAPKSASMEEARTIYGELQRRELHFGSMLVNGIHTLPGSMKEPKEMPWSNDISPELLHAMQAIWIERLITAEQEKAALADFLQGFAKNVKLVTIPRLGRSATGLESLMQFVPLMMEGMCEESS